MPTKLSNQIVLYLHKVVQVTPMRYVPYDELCSQMKESGYRTLNKVELTHALKNLIEKKYIKEEAAHYRLTSTGEEYALSLPQSSPNRVDWLWIGIIIGILVLAIRACDSDVVHPGPATPDQPAVTISVSPRDLGSTPFRIGDEVVVVLHGTVHVRNTPGHLNKSTTDAVCYASTGERFSIVDGPQYIDGLWWWKVSNNRCGQGWIAQSRQDGQIILGYP